MRRSALPRRLKVRQRTLTPLIEVRILAGHPALGQRRCFLSALPRRKGRPERGRRKCLDQNDTRGVTGTESCDRELGERTFYPAKQEADFADAQPQRTPQTQHPAYQLAFRDTDFLLREQLRPVRFQLELMKPEMLLDEARVG